MTLSSYFDEGDGEGGGEWGGGGGIFAVVEVTVDHGMLVVDRVMASGSCKLSRKRVDASFQIQMLKMDRMHNAELQDGLARNADPAEMAATEQCQMNQKLLLAQDWVNQQRVLGSQPAQGPAGDTRPWGAAATTRAQQVAPAPPATPSPAALQDEAQSTILGLLKELKATEDAHTTERRRLRKDLDNAIDVSEQHKREKDRLHDNQGRAVAALETDMEQQVNRLMLMFKPLLVCC
jgi:hypothetical protein